MAITENGLAPYAPPQTVLSFIRRYRERGIAAPITRETLTRASVSESLAPRTLQSLEILDLIDSEGNPTDQLEGLRRAPAPDFPGKLADVLRSAYAGVFQFVDPAKDDSAHIRDAFRPYNPVGQQGRMVTLFIGLCEAAGIVAEGARKPEPRAAMGRPKPRPPAARAPQKRAVGAPARQQGAADGAGVPEPIMSLLRTIPKDGSGMSRARKDEFLAAFKGIFEYSVPTREDDAGEYDGPEDED